MKLQRPQITTTILKKKKKKKKVENSYLPRSKLPTKF